MEAILSKIPCALLTGMWMLQDGQPSDAEAAAAAAGILAVLGVMLFVGLAIALAVQAFICYLLASTLKAVPPQFRETTPGMVWCLMIPCVPIVLNFFVVPKIARSMKKYFDSVGRTDVGDCGEQLGLFYSIAVACCVVPYLNTLTGIAALVLLIMFLVKVTGLKKQIAPAAPAAAA